MCVAYRSTNVKVCETSCNASMDYGMLPKPFCRLFVLWCTMLLRRTVKRKAISNNKEAPFHHFGTAFYIYWRIALLAISALVIMVSKELHLISVVGRLPPFIPFLDLNTFLSIVFETNLCKSIGAYFAIKEEVRLRGMRVVIGDCSDGL